ncbi:MAG: DNA polymerase I, partial [Erysipelotrichia bacterium]|nr:DNA polymerase I [Erysipelotrichia bacterium]
IAREFLKALGIFAYEQDGFEGDDIAGTVALMAEKAGYKVLIYTSDLDFLQLVNDNIHVNIIKKGLSNVTTMTPKLVEETYGFTPSQIVDYKGLRGDSSDNLPGIKGVGPKTAAKLLKQYGTFDNIIKNAAQIDGKIGEAIRTHEDIGKLSRDLAIIRTDVDLPFTIDEMIYHGYEFQNISSFSQTYGLKQFITRVAPKWKISELSNIDIPIKVVTSLKGVDCGRKIGLALDYIDDNYTLGAIYGMAIYNGDTSFYITLANLKKDPFTLKILKDKDIEKYCFDYKAIKVALSKNDIAIAGLKFDLLIASYLLDSSIKNDVQAVMNIHGIDLDGGIETISLFETEDSSKSGKIAFYSLRLAKKISDELKKMALYELFESLEIPLVDTLADMEIEGFPLDRKILDEFGENYQAKITDISNEIFEMVDAKFNLASPKQLGDILFNKLGLSSNRKLSTAVDSLKEIQDEHPVIEKVLEYRKYFKILTTYVEGLKNHIYPNGKIHPKFNQALTTTGRLSSSDPNIQNISVRDEEGRAIRKAFYYPDHQYEILSFD